MADSVSSFSPGEQLWSAAGSEKQCLVAMTSSASVGHWLGVWNVLFMIYLFHQGVNLKGTRQRCPKHGGTAVSQLALTANLT